MHSTHNEGKSIVAKRLGLIRTLKNKIYKHMTAVSKNVYVDVLNAMLINTTYFTTTKIAPTDVKSGFYAEYNIDSNTKGYAPIWSEEVFVISKIKKKLCQGHKLLMFLMVKKLMEHFMKKNCRRQIKKIKR